MFRSGIDVHTYTGHRVRAAATSKAKAMMIPLSGIWKTAGWSQESTFSKFYNKTIPGQNTFADAVLNMWKAEIQIVFVYAVLRNEFRYRIEKLNETYLV